MSNVSRTSLYYLSNAVIYIIKAGRTKNHFAPCHHFTLLSPNHKVINIYFFAVVFSLHISNEAHFKVFEVSLCSIYFSHFPSRFFHIMYIHLQIFVILYVIYLFASASVHINISIFVHFVEVYQINNINNNNCQIPLQKKCIRHII